MQSSNKQNGFSWKKCLTLLSTVKFSRTKTIHINLFIFLTIQSKKERKNPIHSWFAQPGLLLSFNVYAMLLCQHSPHTQFARRATTKVSFQTLQSLLITFSILRTFLACFEQHLFFSLLNMPNCLRWHCSTCSTSSG